MEVIGQLHVPAALWHFGEEGIEPWLVVRTARGVVTTPIKLSRFQCIKVHPITDHWGPEGEYRYSRTLSWPRRLDGGGWLAPRPGRFTPREDPVPIV